MDETPDVIIAKVRKLNIVIGEIEHWRKGIKGDGKVYLNDDRGTLQDRQARRGDGRRVVPTATRRPQP